MRKLSKIYLFRYQEAVIYQVIGWLLQPNRHRQLMNVGVALEVSCFPVLCYVIQIQMLVYPNLRYIPCKNTCSFCATHQSNIYNMVLYTNTYDAYHMLLLCRNNRIMLRRQVIPIMRYSLVLKPPFVWCVFLNQECYHHLPVVACKTAKRGLLPSRVGSITKSFIQ